MPELQNAVNFLFQSFTVTMTFVYLFGVLLRRNMISKRGLTLMGPLFGLAAMAAMMMSVSFADGVIVDLRNVFIGFAAGMFGWLAGLIALAMAMTMQISFGGAGATAAAVGMVIAACMSLVWRSMLRQRIPSQMGGLFVLGLSISTSVLSSVFLPPPFRASSTVDVLLAMAITNVLGTVFLGIIMYREQAAQLANRKLREEASTDPLTHLMNRRHLSERFAKLPRPAVSSGRAMLYFDVDDFKGINDRFGHGAGDEVLQEISARVQGCLRPDDLFCRLGGDEFLVVLPDVTFEIARIVAERCRKSISDRSITADRQAIQATISIGVNWVTSAPAFSDDLAQADAALYLAKRGGRNRVAFRSATAKARATYLHSAA